MQITIKSVLKLIHSVERVTLLQKNSFEKRGYTRYGYNLY